MTDYRHRTTGSDHWQPKPPMSDARRRQVNGPIQSEQPRSWAEIAAWCSFYVAVVVGVILASLYLSWGVM